MRIKALTGICVALLSVCFLGSCEKPGTELSELMIIQCIGLDYENGNYTATVEILNNEQSGSPGGTSNSDQKTKIYNAKAPTVASALRKLTTKSGNVPLFAHNRVIVLGESVTKKDLLDVIDFFCRNYDSRPTQLICTAKKTSAEKVIRAKLLSDSVKGEILENLLEESAKQSLVPRVRVIDAMNYLKETTSCLCIPAVKVQKNGENENYELDGCAVIGYDDKLSAYIDEKSTEGICFLNDEIKKGIINATLPNGKKATMSINKGRTKCDVAIKDGKLCYTVKIEVSCDLEQVEEAEYFNKDNGVIETFQRAGEAALREKAINTMDVLRKTKGSDCIRFGKRLRFKDNKLYHQLENNWAEHFSQAEITINTEVIIRRIGEETFHSKKH